MRFRYILLDWDGCLADTLGVWADAYLSVYEQYGLKTTLPEILKHSWGNVEKGPREMGIVDSDNCWAEITKKVKGDMMKVPLHYYAKELLAGIRAHSLKSAIVTSSPKELIQPALAYHGLSDLVDYVITESEVKKPKPDPEMLNKAIKHLGGVTESLIIIGDTGKDILAGHFAGIATALVLHEENKKYYDFSILKESNPEFTFNNLKDFYEFLMLP